MRRLLRVLIYIIGLGILSLGVVLNTKTGLGVSAVNSIPYVCAQITGISLGTVTMLVYGLYIGIQIILLRKTFNISLLLQLPCSVLFGKYTDFFNQLIQIEPRSVVGQVLLLSAAILLTALGVVLTVNMQIVPNAPDGLVQVIAVQAKKEFGYIKNIFDGVSVLISIIVSLLIERHLIGIGIGTIASALLIGRFIALFNKLGKERLKRLVIG
jgi:uncharacterized membrane protein YczE